MRYSFIVAEGSHDIEVLAQILKSYSLERITKNSERKLDPYWSDLIPSKLPSKEKENKSSKKSNEEESGNKKNNEDLIQPVRLPTFLQNDQLSVALHNAGGESQLAKTISENLSILPVTPTISGIGIILDADTIKSPNERFKSCIKELTKRNLTQLQSSLPSSPGVVTKGSVRCGIFVIPDNSSQGTLEDILMECAERNYPDLLKRSRNYIDNINTSLLTEEDLKEFQKSAGKNKAIISGITSILKPSKSLVVSLQHNRWVDEETLKLDRLVAIRNFVGEIVGAL